jgi:fibro-slime domain-containing protein
MAGMVTFTLLTGCSDDEGAPNGAGDGGTSTARAGSGSRAGSSGSDPFGNSTVKPPAQGGRGGSAGSRPAMADAGQCDKTLRLVVRDFNADHPDFEKFTGSGLDGIVEDDLGANHKPVYAHPGGTAHTSGPDGFADWYEDVPGVNQRFEVNLEFMETGPGVYRYDNAEFFPIDGRGFGNGPNPSHNYLFTTEAHTLFTYMGGEVFTFRGDDDLWVFINGKLAVDLGGLHGPLQETADFDASAARLGIEIGKTYPMDIFHAERHTVQSNFRIETTIDLTCIRNVPVD